jgi:PAS domain S-box-containing protein
LLVPASGQKFRSFFELQFTNKVPSEMYSILRPEDFDRLRARLASARKESGMRGLVSVTGEASGILWARFWMRYAGLGYVGRAATRLATLFAGPYKSRCFLATLNRKGYIAPTAAIHHADLRLGDNVFIGDRAVIYQDADGGPVELGDRVVLHNDIIIEVGARGSLTIGAGTAVQPRCQFEAFTESIRIGRGVMIAPYCAFYNFDHGYHAGELITRQPLQTKGGIVIEDHAWLGVGVIVLAGVRIGKGAVIGAGAVVTHDVPDGAIAAGVPARVLKMREHREHSSRTANPDSAHDQPCAAMIVRDPDGVIRYWSKEAQLMYGWTPQEVLGLCTHDLFKTRFPTSLAAIEEQTREQKSWQGQLVHKRRDGSTIRVHSRWKLQRNRQTRSVTVVEINSRIAAYLNCSPVALSFLEGAAPLF